jgi:hypothetical protein
VVLFEMLAGRRPFEGESALGVAVKRLKHDAPRLASVVEGVAPRWDEVVAACLAREPRDRPPSARAVAEALSGVSASSTERLSRPGPRRWSGRLVAGLFALVALGTAGAGIGLLAKVRERAAATGLDEVQSVVVNLMAVASFHAGDFVRAGALLDESIEQARSAGATARVARLLVNRAVLRAIEGRPAEARAALEELVAELRRVGYVGPTWDVRLAALSLEDEGARRRTAAAAGCLRVARAAERLAAPPRPKRE